MPTYEYECTKCNYHFERFQGISEEPVKRCPKCRCKVKRMIGTGAGIIFKGSGFYETDYRSKSYKDAAEKDRSAVSTTKKSDTSKKKSTGTKGSVNKTTSTKK